MSQAARLTIPKLVMFVCGVFLLIDFFIDVPAQYHSAANMLINFANVIVAFSIGLGVASLLTYHGGTIKKRVAGTWYYAGWLLFIFLSFSAIGFIYGTNSAQYNWLFNNVFVPINQTMYSLMGVYIIYALYKGFQAKSIDVGIMLVTGLLTLIGHAPISEVVWWGFPWIMDNWVRILNLGGYRSFIICSAIGAIAMGIRTILGRGKTIFGA
jgi:hypothetical protein